ncbi:MAG: PIN domain-containing protein [Hyphomicrobiales bacterium]|nr:PIN domain-containing protein [Hyphomicrobiales bacterium]
MTRPGNLRACQRLLGHSKLESTVRYLGIELTQPLLQIVDAVLAGKLGGTAIQLVVSVPMLDRFQDVPVRLGAGASDAEAARLALIDRARSGPDALDPYLLLDRRDVSFPLADEEDAGVLAAAFAARADLLVTDNLGDFAAAGGTITHTSMARHSDGRARQLTRQALRSASGHRLIILHPLQVLAAMNSGTFAEVLSG